MAVIEFGLDMKRRDESDDMHMLLGSVIRREEVEERIIRHIQNAHTDPVQKLVALLGRQQIKGCVGKE